jgi:hypothetical protein
MEMETKPYSLQSPEQIAKDYGGNKQKIAQATQSGLLDPTAAVMAGMFIDRMRNAQTEEQAPVQTVAQDVLASQQPQQTQQPPMPQQMGMDPGMGGQPPMPPQGAGLEALPVPDQMFAGPSMASGGLVAFANAGSVRGVNFSDLPLYEPPKSTSFPQTPLSGMIGRGVDAVRGMGGGEKRIDPETGQPVTLGEFLRLQEARQVAQARAQSPIPVGTSSAAMDMDGGVSEGADTPRLPEVVVEAPLPEASTATAPAAPQAGQGSALDEYARMLMGSLGDRETSREDAKNMALLQAGLGIMGGESQYALQNIARGALPATQAYQQQMAAGRKEERETIGALADLELKAKELGLTEKRYADLARIAEMQVAATLGRASTTGQFTQKDYTKAVLDATKAILSADPTMDPKAAAKLARDQVDAVMGTEDSSDDGTRTMDFNQLKK